MMTLNQFLAALNAATLTPRDRDAIKRKARDRLAARWQCDRAERPLDFSDLVAKIVEREGRLSQ